ncbi:Putative binding domain-containing protein, N-terminal [Bacteroidales bacterium WCE2004]|nr:Putative binding domain-containing protein, N-terminal [Bacteroidales bacterium WCE2004]
MASLLAGAAVLFASCKKEPMMTVTSNFPIEYTAQGGSDRIITFISNQDWVATTNQDWVRLSPVSGTASSEQQTISVTCDPNQSYDKRTAWVAIEAEGIKRIVYISQMSVPVLQPKQAVYEISADSQQFELEVQSTLDYSVQVDGSWLSRIETKAMSDSKVVFNVNANLSGTERTASIVIQADKSLADIERIVTVKQAPEKPGVPVMVDLGLSVKWANINLGAAKCSDAGDFFAWGEVEPKKEFTEENYRFYSGDPDSPTKYFVYNHNGGTGDGIKDLLPEDDAAVQILGDGWCMPTAEQLYELFSLSREHVTIDGMPGLKLYGRKNPENWIFLPAPRGFDDTEGDNPLACYWGRTGYDVAPFAWMLTVSPKKNTLGIGETRRCFGYTIRPVRE